jgi:hypothetical protein
VGMGIPAAGCDDWGRGLAAGGCSRQGVCRRQAGGDNGEKMAEAGAGLPSLGLAQIWLNSDCSTGRVPTLVLDLTAGM